MTVLHLAARFGHVDVLEVLRGKVPWSMASVKVRRREEKLLLNSFENTCEINGNGIAFPLEYTPNETYKKLLSLTEFIRGRKI